MKLLLFSDLHCQTTAARSIVTRSGEVDVVVGAGDFASVRKNIAATIDVLREIDKPAVLVPGNNESLDELLHACRGWTAAHVLHGQGVSIDGVEFFGLGGGVPVTPFGAWSFDLTEEEAAGLLADCPDGAVLVSHSPPHGVLDVSSRGRALGSVAVRDTVVSKKPLLVVCGHIHESGGQSAVLENTPVVNAGPDGMLWDLTI